MASIRLRNNKILSDYSQPYVVAELNTSHFGNISLAKEMITQAKLAGCDCVKFQSWTSDTLYSQNYYDANRMAKRFIEKFSFNESNLFELSLFCKEINIDFASTPYSRNEVDFLVDTCNVPFIKVASMDLNNFPYLNYIAVKGIPIILSTGMANIDEIKKAVNVITNTGNTDLSILHCVSIYPTSINSVQLNNILGLRKEFPSIPIGFSDHTLGIEMGIAATALGIAILEKHFTLDNERIGMDNQMATEFIDMSKLVSSCKNVSLALGSHERCLSAEEFEQRQVMRRSVVTSRPLKAGTILSISDLDVKRPGSGFEPQFINKIVGHVLAKDIDGNMLLTNEYIPDFK